MTSTAGWAVDRVLRPMEIEHNPAERMSVARVTFVGDDGDARTIDATPGDSVMATAVREGVGGIIGECGGNVSCGTCHVWVRPNYFPAVGQPGDLEEDLLDMGTSDRRSTSRLSCQIEMTDELDGLVVDIPPDQP